MTEFERILLSSFLACFVAFLLAVWLGKKPDNALSRSALCMAGLTGMISLLYEIVEISTRMSPSSTTSWTLSTK